MHTSLKWYEILLQILLSICLFLCILSSSVFLTLAFKPLYYFDIDYLNIPEESGYEKDVIKENYDALIDYNLPLTDGELVFPGLAMSEHGKQHFAEVKDIFDLFKGIALVTLPLCAVGIAFFHRKKPKFYLPVTTALTIGLPLIGGGLIAANWEKVFITFHELFFDNDYWMFDPRTDPVITILPDGFFMHCAVMILALTILGGIICLVLFCIGNKKHRKTASELK